MNRRAFLLAVTGAAVSPMLPKALAPAPAKVLKLVYVDEITTWMSLCIQVEIDREIIQDLRRVAGKSPPPDDIDLPWEEILASNGYIPSEKLKLQLRGG